jgi:alkaline phosphatase
VVAFAVACSGLVVADAAGAADRTTDLTNKAVSYQPTGQVRNVILFIGDGMGDSQIALARNYLKGATGTFEGIDALPFTGSYTTYSLDAITAKPDYSTDSAASATGFATGTKTYDGAIGVNRYNVSVTNLFEAAKSWGMRTGNITTDTLTGATPAAQVAHVVNRACTGPNSTSPTLGSTLCKPEAVALGGRGSIAEQLVMNPPDLAFGGGRDLFGTPDNPATGGVDESTTSGQMIHDGVGLLALDSGHNLAQAWVNRGGSYITKASQISSLTTADLPVLGVFSTDILPAIWKPAAAAAGGAGSSATPTTCTAEPASESRPTLKAMTEKAIQLLNQPAPAQGFLLQIEGSGIDKRAHAADPCGQIGETKDLDEAVKAALDFAIADGHTLVILTADHGQASMVQDGPVVKDGSSSDSVKGRLLSSPAGGQLWVTYPSYYTTGNSAQHNGTQLRIAAYGPGAANVVGLTDQTDVFALIDRALALGFTPNPLPPLIDTIGGAMRTTGERTATVKAAMKAEAGARNVILITAPGLGDTELTLARNYLKGAGGSLTGLDAFPMTGELTTSAVAWDKDSSKWVPDYVPDLASASATLTTGVKARDGTVGLKYDGTTARTLLENARAKGLRTGIVTTDALYNAVAASEFSHTTNLATDSTARAQKAEALIGAARPTVAIGGGQNTFTPYVSQAQNLGYRYYTSFSALPSSGATDASPVLAVIHSGDKATNVTGGAAVIGGAHVSCTVPALDSTNLGALTTKAIGLLNQAAPAKGFYLHVGTSGVLRAGNAANPCQQIGYVREVDAAVQAALAFAAADGNTLVIFTGAVGGSAQIVDNSGSAALTAWVNGTADAATLKVLYSNANASGGRQTGTQVPVYAYGPGAANVLGVHANTEVADIIRRVLGLSVTAYNTPAGLPVTAATPIISGTPTVGSAVSVSVGTWTPSGLSFTYQWKIGSTVVGTGSSYTPKAADAGKTLTVTVTGSKTGYTVTAKVSAGKTVAAPPGYTPQMEWFTLSPDLNGDGRGEVLALKASSGALYAYPASTSGSLTGGTTLISSGMQGQRIFGPGDWNGDGKADVVTVDKSGYMWLYPGDGKGNLGTKKEIGHGWTPFRIIPAGDLTQDGANDMLAIDAGGRLWLYAGNGSGGFKGQPKQVGQGWVGLELYAAGDLNNDGKNDILAILPNSTLWAYSGRGNGTFSVPRQVGRGWGTFELAAGADLNGDGRADIVGRYNATGELYYYQGNGGGSFQAAKKIGSSW